MLFTGDSIWGGSLARLGLSSWMRAQITWIEDTEETLGRVEENHLQKNNPPPKKKSPKGAGERGISGKTQADQYRQKLEDVFSGQEPIAKFSGDVNSKALPVFKSARDAGGCQDDIKQKKRKKRWKGGGIVERSHMTDAMVMFSILLISFQIDPRPKNKDF